MRRRFNSWRSTDGLYPASDALTNAGQDTKAMLVSGFDIQHGSSVSETSDDQTSLFFVVPSPKPITVLGHHLVYDEKATQDAQQRADAFIAARVKKTPGLARIMVSTPLPRSGSVQFIYDECCPRGGNRAATTVIPRAEVPTGLPAIHRRTTAPDRTASTGNPRPRWPVAPTPPPASAGRARAFPGAGERSAFGKAKPWY